MAGVNWGGARPGAGRKALAEKRQLLSCRISVRTKETITKVARETGEGVGAVIDFIVADYERRLRNE